MGKYFTKEQLLKASVETLELGLARRIHVDKINNSHMTVFPVMQARALPDNLVNCTLTMDRGEDVITITDSFYLELATDEEETKVLPIEVRPDDPPVEPELPLPTEASETEREVRDNVPSALTEGSPPEEVVELLSPAEAAAKLTLESEENV